MSAAEYDRLPGIAPRDYASPLAAKLHHLWETKPGVIGWLSSVDHKEIGLRYIITAFIFLILGGIEALVLRIQLAGPEQSFLTPEQYGQLFTMHGSTMILWYAFPILTGFSVYLQPLVLGTRDMAMPRLNAFTYWMFLLSGIYLYAGFAIGSAHRMPAGSTTCPTPHGPSILVSTSISTRCRTFCSGSRLRSAR